MLTVSYVKNGQPVFYPKQQISGQQTLMAFNSSRSASQNMADNQKFRDSSIYNKNLSLQIMKEQMLKNREIELRKKYEGIDPEKLKDIFPAIQKQTYNLKDVYTRPLSPNSLNKQTYLEIFNSRKESMKKPLNFINYSNIDYNVISNDMAECTGANDNFYAKYLSKRLDYESQIPQYKDAVHNTMNNSLITNQVIAAKIMDPTKFIKINEQRKVMRLNMKSHILKNIKRMSNNKEGTLPGSQQGSKMMMSTNGRKLVQSAQESPKENKDSKTSNFNALNFYKMLEESFTLNNQPKQQQLNSGPKVKSVFHKKSASVIHQTNNLTQGNSQIPSLKQTLNKADDDTISVIGKQNPIKENAYSQVNVDQELLSQYSKARSSRFMDKINDKHRIQHSQQSSSRRLNHSNLKELQQQNSNTKRDVKAHNPSQIDKRSNKQSIDNNSSFSKRWKNLENYIDSKKSKKIREEARSQAQEYIDNERSQYNDDTKSKSTIIQHKRHRKNRSVIEVIDSEDEQGEQGEQDNDHQLYDNQDDKIDDDFIYLEDQDSSIIEDEEYKSYDDQKSKALSQQKLFEKKIHNLQHQLDNEKVKREELERLISKLKDQQQQYKSK